MSNDMPYERPTNTDRLTGVYNTRFLHEVLTREVTNAENRQGGPLTILMLDIDRMMRVNHTHGHEAGNKVLQSVAEILRSFVRPQDYVFRFGGDEFAILLPGTDRAGGLRIGENIRNSIAASEGLVGQITVTIAVRQYRVGEGEHSFVAGVDEALYRQMNQRFREEKGLLPLESPSTATRHEPDEIEQIRREVEKEMRELVEKVMEMERLTELAIDEEQKQFSEQHDIENPKDVNNEVPAFLRQVHDLQWKMLVLIGERGRTAEDALIRQLSDLHRKVDALLVKQVRSR
jgi:diguanylate cyclase (GGDEF)-like protein